MKTVLTNAQRALLNRKYFSFKDDLVRISLCQHITGLDFNDLYLLFEFLMMYDNIEQI